MKKLQLFLTALFAIATALAAPKIKGVTNNGAWKTSSTWDLNRIPISADTIIVPANKVLIVSNPQTLGNVYIQIYGTLLFSHGKLTLGDNTQIVVFPCGTIKGDSNSEKIKIGSTEVFNGSDNDIFGPAIANNTTGNGFGSFNLPVKFLKFNVYSNANNVIIEWATTEELNAGRFEVERSTDGSNWNKIASLRAAGNSTTNSNYSFTDMNVQTEVAYYRIRQVDEDGQFMYTSTKVFKNELTLVSNVKVTSMQSKIVVQFRKKIQGTTVIRYITLGGQVLGQDYLTNAYGEVVLIPGNHIKGNIVVSIYNAQDMHMAKQILL